MKRLLARVLVRKMRGTGDERPDANLTYPADYQDYAHAVAVERDLTYPSRCPDNRLDLYLPREGEGPFPLMVWVHGGAFVAGSKGGTVNLCTMTAARGFGVISLDYAVAPEYRYPTAVVQVNEFLAHLPALSRQFPRLDTGRVVLAGDSAGAQIAAQAAAVETNPTLAGEMGLTPRLPSGALRGTALCCGPFDLPALAGAGDRRLRLLASAWGWAYFGTRDWMKSPLGRQTVVGDWVAERFPPTFITDGNGVSFEVQGRKLGEALRAKGVPVLERYFPREEGEVVHDYLFSLDDPNALLGFEDLIAFLERYGR